MLPAYAPNMLSSLPIMYKIEFVKRAVTLVLKHFILQILTLAAFQQRL